MNVTPNEKQLIDLIFHTQPKEISYLGSIQKHTDIVAEHASGREFDVKIKCTLESITTTEKRYSVNNNGKVEHFVTPKGQLSKNGVSAWLPLAVIREYGDWGIWVPDWSFIRDDTKENQWRMFYATLAKLTQKKLFVAAK